MKVVVFTSFFAPAFLGGGPIRTLVAMLRGAPSGFETAVVTGDRDLGCTEPLDVRSDQWTEHEGSKVFYCNGRSWTSLFRGMREVRFLRADAVYVNSFFDPRFSILPQFLFRIGLFSPDGFVIAPRGEFSPGALVIKGAKKQAYLRLFRLVGLSQRVLWHASTGNEAHDIQALFGTNSRIIIREDDTMLPAAATRPERRTGPGILRAVSLSRLSPKKGVVTLLEGLRAVSEPLVLDVIGPAEDAEYFELCRRAAAAVPPNVQINFVGPKDPDQIRATLAGYDVMFCPTKGENFGHVIAEALSVSCPVLCADVTPWTGLLALGAGQVVPENTAAGWGNAVQGYAALSRTEVFERRLRAGKAYEKWSTDSSAPHFFSLLERQITGRAA